MFFVFQAEEACEVHVGQRRGHVDHWRKTPLLWEIQGRRTSPAGQVALAVALASVPAVVGVSPVALLPITNLLLTFVTSVGDYFYAVCWVCSVSNHFFFFSCSRLVF